MYWVLDVNYQECKAVYKKAIPFCCTPLKYFVLVQNGKQQEEEMDEDWPLQDGSAEILPWYSSPLAES